MLENILLNWSSIFIVLQCQLDNSKLLKMGRGHTTSILLGDNNCDLHCLEQVVATNLTCFMSEWLEGCQRNMI
jgi:hypothetical protein